MLPGVWMVVAAAAYLVGVQEYIVATLRGKAKPNRVSWLLWGVAAGVSLVAEIRQSVGWPAVLTAMVTIGPLGVFVASLVNPKAYWRLTRFDLTCGLFAVFGLILWQATDVANLAIVFGILADFAAALPTINKAYRAPQTERAQVFLLSVVAAVITLLVIARWDFANYAWPVYLVGLNVLFIALIQFGLGPRLGRPTARSPLAGDGRPGSR